MLHPAETTVEQVIIDMSQKVG